LKVRGVELKKNEKKMFCNSKKHIFFTASLVTTQPEISERHDHKHLHNICFLGAFFSQP